MSQSQQGIPVFRLIVVGDQSVGKSSIVCNYAHNAFNENQRNTTIGVEFVKKLITVEKKQIELQIWDTAGQEQFRSMIKSFYKGAAAAFIVYNANSHDSFEKLHHWLKELEENAHEEIIKVLVGNKCDLERKVTREEAKAFMNTHKISLFFETSAKTGENVEEAFIECIKVVILRMFNSETFKDSIKIIKRTPASSRDSSRQATARGEQQPQKENNNDNRQQLDPKKNNKKQSCC